MGVGTLNYRRQIKQVFLLPSTVAILAMAESKLRNVVEYPDATKWLIEHYKELRDTFFNFVPHVGFSGSQKTFLYALHFSRRTPRRP